MSDQTVLRGLLHDRVAVVTGAGRGIGRVCATTLVSAGASVIINDLDAEPAAEAVAECHAIRPGSAVASIGSVTDPKYTDELMKAAVDRFGKLDILVNNAGLSRDKMCHLMPDEWWDLVIDVNLTGTFNCIRSAAPYLREAGKRELEELIREYGEERYASKIAEMIVLRRKQSPFLRTLDLADAIKLAVPSSYERGRIHPATRTFQALRIAVNDEFGALKDAIAAARKTLKVGGRLAIITFHSLEDRIVKLAFKEADDLEVITKKPLVPTDAEQTSNPRSRSAKLRVVEKAQTKQTPNKKYVSHARTRYDETP